MDFDPIRFIVGGYWNTERVRAVGGRTALLVCWCAALIMLAGTIYNILRIV